MLHEDPGNVSYSAVGGLSDQIRELRESIELPLMNPELFVRVGIKPPKVTKFFSLPPSPPPPPFYIHWQHFNLTLLQNNVFQRLR
jgi:hypothetical protein